MFISVSYTHLDVYKRQRYRTRHEVGGDATATVSYTHLDVYKRQLRNKYVELLAINYTPVCGYLQLKKKKKYYPIVCT